jgi:hypothetical protein
MNEEQPTGSDKRITDLLRRKEKLGSGLLEKIESHPQKGEWQEALAATILMPNSAGHPDGKQAFDMLVNDVERACRREAPADIIKFALEEMIKWRNSALGVVRPDGDVYEGEITMEMFEKKLRDKLPGDYFDQIFS